MYLILQLVVDRSLTSTPVQFSKKQRTMLWQTEYSRSSSLWYILAGMTEESRRQTPQDSRYAGAVPSMMVAGNQYRSEYVCTTKESSMIPTLAPLQFPTILHSLQCWTLGCTLSPRSHTRPTFYTPVPTSQHKRKGN